MLSGLPGSGVSQNEECTHTLSPIAYEIKRYLNATSVLQVDFVLRDCLV
jgi:hypothetical protein